MRDENEAIYSADKKQEDKQSLMELMRGNLLRGTPLKEVINLCARLGIGEFSPTEIEQIGKQASEELSGTVGLKAKEAKELHTRIYKGNSALPSGTEVVNGDKSSESPMDRGLQPDGSEDIFENDALNGAEKRLKTLNITKNTESAESAEYAEYAESGENGELEDEQRRIETAEVSSEFDKWFPSAEGIFTYQDVYVHLGAKTPSQKTCIRNKLQYLASQGKELERYGTREGTFRRKKLDIDRLEYTTPGKGEPIVLPLGLGSLVTLYGSNVVVVAGSPDSGKTAILLNVLKDNIGIYKVHYFSSEMGAEELSLRLGGFDHLNPKLIFEKAHIYERSSDFHDVIQSGKGNLNIIDYLEIDEDFHHVGGLIRKIWERLDGALAFIAIQKKQGAKFGRGAEFSMEKPRLYLSVDSGTVKIVKAKNWKDSHDNPNGKILTFKLVNGATLIPSRMGWHKPEN